VVDLGIVGFSVNENGKSGTVIKAGIEEESNYDDSWYYLNTHLPNYIHAPHQDNRSCGAE